MAAPSHKRALRSGETPAAKKLKNGSQSRPKHAYLTIEIIKTDWSFSGETHIDTVIKYHHTHDNQEDAENALRAMAN